MLQWIILVRVALEVPGSQLDPSFAIALMLVNNFYCLPRENGAFVFPQDATSPISSFGNHISVFEHFY